MDAKQGAGFSFGSVAQLVLGFGLIEAVARGVIFALFIRALLSLSVYRHAWKWWFPIVWMILCLSSQNMVREGMFSFFTVLFQGVILIILVTAVLPKKRVNKA